MGLCPVSCLLAAVVASGAVVPSVGRPAELRSDDLDRHFNGPGLVAKQSFDQGDFEGCLKALEPVGERHPDRYLRARALHRSGRPKEAIDGYRALVGTYPVMRERLHFFWGLAAEELGRWGEAAARYREVPAGSLLHGEARLGLARALERAGDLASAMGALDEVAAAPGARSGRDVGAEALWHKAELARRGKQLDLEAKALVALWTRHPLSGEATLAEQRLGGPKAVALEALVDRGEILVEAHRNRAALELLGPALARLPVPSALGCRGRFLVGKAYRKEREHAKAIEVLSVVAEQCPENELLARALYVLGSSQSIVASRAAVGTYQRLVGRFPSSNLADDALFYAADVEQRHGDARRALALLEQVVLEYPGGDFAAEALFKSFWLQRKAKRLDEALVVLDLLETLVEPQAESYEKERAQYWRARLEEDRGEVDTGRQRLRALVASHPTTYYGLIARSQLGEHKERSSADAGSETGVLSRPRPPWPLAVEALQADPHFLPGIELLRLGFLEAASAELRAVDERLLSGPAARAMAHLLVQADDAPAAQALSRVALRGELTGEINASNRAAWEVAYPWAFRDLVEQHSRAADLDPDLLQALMREESALDPKALSWAGAMGLTQLMPSTAAEVAAKLKLGRFSTEHLLEPDTSIRLGAAYLGDLVRRFRGVKQFALAGYNAGESAVDRWRRDRPAAPLDAWVEDIPIAETRGYVKRVLRTYNTYQLLRGISCRVDVVAN